MNVTNRNQSLVKSEIRHYFIRLMISLFVSAGGLLITAVPDEPQMGGNLTLTCENTDLESFDFVDWIDAGGNFVIGSK